MHTYIYMFQNESLKNDFNWFSLLGNQAQEEEDNRLEIEEAVFMQSYIPTSLHDLANPYMEADRLRTGQREPSFQAAVNKMLGGASKAQASSSRGAHDKATAARGLSEGDRIIRCREGRWQRSWAYGYDWWLRIFISRVQFFVFSLYEQLFSGRQWRCGQWLGGWR